MAHKSCTWKGGGDFGSVWQVQVSKVLMAICIVRVGGGLFFPIFNVISVNPLPWNTTPDFALGWFFIGAILKIMRKR